jgi:hypothetical protein
VRTERGRGLSKHREKNRYDFTVSSVVLRTKKNM